MNIIRITHKDFISIFTVAPTGLYDMYARYKFYYKNHLYFPHLILRMTTLYFRS